MPFDYTITLHDPRDDTDEVIAERHAFLHLLEREVLPDEPETPLEQTIASIRTLPARLRMWSIRAHDESGALCAAVGTSVDPESDTNPDIFRVGLNVLPEHRRRGLGSMLLAEMVAVARTEGRTRLLVNTNERVPAGAEFATRFGGQAKQAEHLNRLLVADIDRPMLEKWVAEAPDRASEYELIAFDGRVPDDLLEKFVDLVLVMNTAPRDDLEMNDFTLTADELREDEERYETMGLLQHHWTVLTRHVPTGALTGFHDISWDPSNPEVMWVGATGVKPEHRGHALGKWLKAAMTLRILDEKPDVTEIRTGNADSNDAMLGINHLMGYRPMIAMTRWELQVDEVEKRLADKGVQPVLG